MEKRSTKLSAVVVGVDLGDRASHLCMVNAAGERVLERKVPTTQASLGKVFGALGPCRVVLEAGTQARWVSGLLEGAGHSVAVVNPRKMRRIYAGQAKLDVLRVRDLLVRQRTAAVNLCRSLLKQEGVAVRKGSTEAFARRARPAVPEGLGTALSPLLDEIESLTARVKDLDREVDALGSREPGVRGMRQVPGVGAVTAAAFAWTIGDPGRFAKSRQAGAFLGLRPRRDQSGETDKQLRITKAGNPFLRRLLVGSAQYVLGPFGPDTALRRWGLKLAERGGKRAKRKAVVAVARKLAVLLHRLWATGEVYQPFPEVTGRRAA